MKHRCKVVGCSSTSDQPEVKFFAFPTKDRQCKLWVAFTGNAALEERFFKKGYITRSTSRICCKHFQDSDFTNCWKEKLNRGAVPSQNGPLNSQRPPDKAVIFNSFARRQSPHSLDQNFIKEENTSDEFHSEVNEENFERDEPENVSEYPIAHSNKDLDNRNPTFGKTVTMVLDNNCKEDVRNEIGSGSDSPSKKIKVSLSHIHEMNRLRTSPIMSPAKKRESFTIKRRTLLLNKSNSSNNKVSIEDCPNEDLLQTSFMEPKKCNNAKFRSWLKRIESYLSKSNVSPKMHYSDLLSTKNDLNCIYVKVIEKSAEILEKIPTHILNEITGLDSSIFLEMKIIRKMLSAKQKLIISYLKNKESEELINSDSSEVQRLSGDSRALNENLSFTSVRLNHSGEQCKTQAQKSPVSSSASVQLPQSPCLIKVREITQMCSIDHNTQQNALSSESSLDCVKNDSVLANNEKSIQSYDVTGNSLAGSGPVKIRTSSLKTNSRTAISQDCPFLPVESAMKSSFKIGCQTSVDTNCTKVQLVEEMSGTNECIQADKITPSSLKASSFNHCLLTFQPKAKDTECIGDDGGEGDSFESSYFKSKERAAGPSKVAIGSQDAISSKVKKKEVKNAATRIGVVANARARMDGMATSKNSTL